MATWIAGSGQPVTIRSTDKLARGLMGKQASFEVRGVGEVNGLKHTEAAQPN
jgi:hypothetical protein